MVHDGADFDHRTSDLTDNEGLITFCNCPISVCLCSQITCTGYSKNSASLTVDVFGDQLILALCQVSSVK